MSVSSNLVLSLIFIASLAFADMITLSSTSSLTMVFNSILASKVLKEVFTKYDLASIGLISIGSTLCVFFSNYEEEELTNQVSCLYLHLNLMQSIIDNYLQAQSIIFILIAYGFVTFSYLYGRK